MTTLFDDILRHTQRPYLDRARARPFLKWAGGKRTLIPEIAQRLPESFHTYWEPFLGGGAVFFALDSRIANARLSDVNGELALTYQMVKAKVQGLIDLLKHHESQHHLQGYYQSMRKMIGSPDALDVAARFIYLNKTCFNGLYRVNKKGEFNVPQGRYAKPVICDVDNLHNASEVLQKAMITFGDFEAQVDPGGNDFIYCDPPYHGTFTGYDASGFGEGEQRRLRDAVLRWHRQGAAIMVSNADTPLIRNLYGNPPFVLHEVSAPRNINCKGNGRGAAADLLVTTYA